MSRIRVGPSILVGCALAGLGMLLATRRHKTLVDRVVLITGGSRGLGLAMAREFGRRGCRLAICARNRDELERAKDRLLRQGHDVYAVTCDVANRESLSSAIRAVSQKLDHIDILVNNAGEMIVSPLENLDVDDFDRAMNVMFWGPLHATFEVLPAMRHRGQGHIVNITSIGGRVSVPHLLSYSCAKAAQVALSDGVRNEVQRFGIDVTTVVPGLMRTGSHVNARFKGNQEAEATWFGAAASMPLLSLDAAEAARMVVDAVASRKPQLVLGTPAKSLLLAQALIPDVTAELLQFSNSLLPEGGGERSARSGMDLNLRGAVYDWLTTLGRRAGQELNQQPT